jgi:phosphatidylethanolamine/phosphatidyl-N-methylethanolamine N-methyltransferase
LRNDTPDSPPPASARPGAARTAAAASTTAAPPDALAFFMGFLRHPFEVGSVVASSSWLERRILRQAQLADARVVVELGPGTGGTTRAFLRAMRPDARLLAIELSDAFHAHLSATQHDPRLLLEHASAERIGELLAAHGLPAADAVISGIPFSTMPADVGERIAAAVAGSLAPGGRFVAYQVTDYVARRMKPIMGPGERQFELLNIPPMQVFTWRRPAA